MTTRRCLRPALEARALYAVMLFGLILSLGACTHQSVLWHAYPSYQDAFDAVGVEGTFVLHRMGTQEFRTNDRQRAERRFLPASTFKIFNALVALESGVIPDEHETFAWDGIERFAPSWNQDHDLASAIRVSAVWYFQELARRIGPEVMQHWIDAVGYGNQDIGGPPDLFWLRGNLRISPLEQVLFLERLYREDLPFSHRSMQITKEIILLENGGDWVLHGKTGWGGEGKDEVGWFVGYVERGDDVWFFANNIAMVDDAAGQHRVGLAKEILRREGIMSGADG